MTRLIWCLGMYASASTWLFNAARELSARHGPFTNVFVSDTSGPHRISVAPHATTIVKSHEINDPACLSALARHSTQILITIRDPRDAVTSLMQHHAQDFDRALTHVNLAARLCLRFAADRRSLFLPYETGFFEQPATIAAIDSHLGFATDAAVRDGIFQSLQRAEVENFISGLATLPGVLQDRASGDLLDPRTHWHTHHAGRTGEIGKWKTKLTAEQTAQISASLGDVFTLS